MGTTKTVTLIPGDGIGPEVTAATTKIIDATGVRINWERCEAGTEVFKKGLASGVPQETIDSILRNKIALKGPLETPVGYGEKSANVTLRKLFETYGNIRPVREFPGVTTPYSGRDVDFVIVRENVEDLYAGIEYLQTPSVAQCLKLITHKGCEKIVRLAFEVARAEGRKTVHCASKSNIMKMTEGLLKRTFETIAKEYPDITSQHIIVDNCAHQLVKKPEQFEVIVTTNMNGDILSDLGSALIGGLGFAPGANIGNEASIFEAVHGSAPKYAGKNVINPTAVLLSGVMMLRYMGEFEAANLIEQSLFYTLGVEKGLTRDVVGDNDAVSATAFTDAIIRNFDKPTDLWHKRDYKPIKLPNVPKGPTESPYAGKVVGVDVFIQSVTSAANLGQSLETLSTSLPVKLKTISSRGVKVFPFAGVEPDMVDLWSCRFVSTDQETSLSDEAILKLLSTINAQYKWVHVEKLQEFNSTLGYTKAQGED